MSGVNGLKRGRLFNVHFLTGLIVLFFSLPAAALPMSFPDNVRGVTFAPIEELRLGDVGYGTEPSEQALVEIAKTGATWISLTPFGRMDNLETPVIKDYFEIMAKENDARIQKTAAFARSLGLKVALIPHIWVETGEWRGEIEMKSDAEFEAWFQEYDRYVLHWAEQAEKMGASLFSIGVEFRSTTNLYEERWRQTIALVRSIYSGPITYSANWDEVETVPFWDALDAIGINAFWPLADKPGDGYEVMLTKSSEIAEGLERYYSEWMRPVVFTEFGVKSAADSALAPWEWPEHCNSLSYDEDYQAEAYAAVFEVMTANPWFLGAFIWKYFSDPYDETQETRAGFTPKYKSAERMLTKWYRADWPTFSSFNPTLFGILDEPDYFPY
jgi:hypothetical protein